MFQKIVGSVLSEWNINTTWMRIVYIFTLTHCLFLEFYDEWGSFQWTDNWRWFHIYFYGSWHYSLDDQNAWNYSCNYLKKVIIDFKNLSANFPNKSSIAKNNQHIHQKIKHENHTKTYFWYNWWDWFLLTYT